MLANPEPQPAPQSARAGSWKPLWAVVAAWLGMMVLVNLAFHRWPGWSVMIGVAATVALAGLAVWATLGAGDLGLARSTWAAGLRLGGICVLLAATGYGIALLIPAARTAAESSGGGPAGSLSSALVAALLVIPLGTVIPEELAFRGVLWGVLRRARGRWTATLLSSLLFGLWHMTPALGGGSANQAIDAVAGGGTIGFLVRVGGTVAFTAAAGVLFCELRVRSGSLLAPVLAHWAVNGIGVLYVQLA
jgi:membrane protease YdiL (CAAX protease family)